MRVTILGSGTAIPNPDRLPSGVLVQTESEALLVDIGPGTLRRLPAVGVDLAAIDAVLLTHYHTDHTADLPSLLFALRNPRYANRPALRIRGATGLHEFLGHLTAAWRWLDPCGAYPLEIEAVDPGAFTLGSLRVTAVPIQHTAQSLGYRLEDQNGAVVAFSGDAGVCDGLVEVARGADLFVCESSFPDDRYVEGHLTPKLAGAAAAAAGVRTLCLTHFYPECDGHDLRAQAAATFDGEIVLARDLLELRVGDRRHWLPDTGDGPPLEL